jgi:diguanylate cyclase (GGDEF)-like protein
MGRREHGPNRRAVLQSGLPQQDTETLRRLLVAGYLTAAGVATFALLLPGSDQGNDGLLVVVAAALLGAGSMVAGRRLPPVAVRIVAFPGAIVLTSLLVVVARPLGPAPLYYLWPALTCGHFGTRREAAATSLMLCVCFGAALPFAHDAQVPVITYVSVVSISLLVIAGYQRQRDRTGELTAELAIAAGHDVLTGLPNRATLAAELPRRLEDAKRRERLLGLLFIDLDRFKSINDGYGHAAGDELLRAVAERLRRSVAQEDLVVRHSGDEFLVLTSIDTRRNLDGVRERVERVYEAPFALSVGVVHVSGSVGAAAYPDEALSGEELLSRADVDMYERKQQRRRRQSRAPRVGNKAGGTGSRGESRVAGRTRD